MPPKVVQGDLSILGTDNSGNTLFLHSCAFWLLFRSEAVNEVARAYAWWEKGALGMKYPGGLSVALVKAIEAFEAGIRKGTRQKIDEKNQEFKARAGRGR